MNCDLMLDTLNTVMDRTQSQLQHILRKNNSLTSKMRYVSLNLAQFKFQLLQWLLNIIKQSKTNQSLQYKLYQLKTQTFQQLSHIRLHTLLKSKLNQLKKSSFLNSTIKSQLNDDNNISKLQQSVILLQKDMNIHEEQEQDFNISSIIQKTKLNLLQDNPLNLSTISQSSLFLQQSNLQTKNGFQPCLKDQQSFREQHQSSIKKQQMNFKFLQNKEKHNNFNKVFPQDELKIQNLSQLIQDSTSKNQQIFTKTQTQQINTIKQSKQIFTKEQKKIQQNEQNQKPLMIGVQKIMRKKKKNIYTTNGNSQSISKQDLLGNLLEQSYNQHFQQNP